MRLCEGMCGCLCVCLYVVYAGVCWYVAVVGYVCVGECVGKS